MSRKSQWLGALVALAMTVVAAPAMAQNLVSNPSFELPALGGLGDNTLNIVADWSGDPIYGVSYELPQLETPYGNQWGYVNTATTGALVQQTATVVAPGQVYTLSAAVGRRTDNPASTNAIEIWVGGAVANGSVVGGTLVASQPMAQVTGIFVQGSTSWSAPEGSPLIGQPISVRLVSSSTGGQINWDNVSLTAVRGVPTLSEWSMILLSLMLAGAAIVAIRTRRSPA